MIHDLGGRKGLQSSTALQPAGFNVRNARVATLHNIQIKYTHTDYSKT